MKWGLPEAEAKLKEIAELEARMAEAGFWDDQQEAQAVIARLNSLRKTAETWSRLRREWQELMELTEIALLEDEQDMAPEIGRNLESLRAQLAELELTQLLNGKHDRNNAIITLHSGAGGLVAQDWAEMPRGYMRWAERKGFCRGGPGLPARRRGGHQEPQPCWSRGWVRLRLLKGREGSPPPGADFSL